MRWTHSFCLVVLVGSISCGDDGRGTNTSDARSDSSVAADAASSLDASPADASSGTLHDARSTAPDAPLGVTCEMPGNAIGHDKAMTDEYCQQFYPPRTYDELLEWGNVYDPGPCPGVHVAGAVVGCCTFASPRDDEFFRTTCLYDADLLESYRQNCALDDGCFSDANPGT